MRRHPAIPALPEVPAYEPGSVVSGEPSAKLSSNELALGPGPAVIAAIRAMAPEAHVYPTDDELRASLAKHHGVGAEQVLVSNGSDEVCYLIGSALIEPGDRVVLSEPPYRINEIVSVLSGAEIEPVPLRDGGHDLDALASAARNAKLLWLPTPHNPTGVAIPSTALGAFLREVPADCWVVLDEAYRAFLWPENRPDSVRQLERHPNLIVQRTLSKSAGLAGVRIGFAIAGPEAIASLARLKAPFNVNAAALAAAQAALDHPGWGENAVARVQRLRREFEAGLEELGVEFWPSQANFVSLRPRDPEAAIVALARRGIAVRDGAGLGLDGWIRITIGSAPRMRLVREALNETEGSG